MLSTDEALAALPKRKPQTLRILQFPDPTLKQVSVPILADIRNDQFLQGLLDDMVDTMQRAQAVGLAAVQVGAPVRALVVRDPTTNAVHKVINPALTVVSEEMERSREGCLSFMGLFLDVKRPKKVSICYLNENGDTVTLDADNLLARAIHHEIDHLDGKTFLDRLSQPERMRAMEKNRLAKRQLKKVIKSLASR